MADILIIDDDPNFRAMMTDMLVRENHRVSAAADGSEGIRIYKNDTYDLVITDLVMPEKEGIETIMDLKKINPEVKIIAISGGGRIGPEVYLQCARELGASQALMKPFKKSELLAAIADCLPG